MYAHTKQLPSGEFAAVDKWEPLFSERCPALGAEYCEACEGLADDHGHLNKVARLAGKFAAGMFPAGSPDAETARAWGELAGWWHDLGKFAPEWQAYLRSKADPHEAEVAGKVDHSTAGAQFAVRASAVFGHLIAYGIAGHHSGMLDAKNEEVSQQTRLSKTVCFKDDDAPESLRNRPLPPLPACLQDSLKAKDSFPSAFFIRMLFSCLVDADFLATEAFMNDSDSNVRNHRPPNALTEIERLVRAKIDSFGRPEANDIVNVKRAEVVADCLSSAEHSPGVFTLTVPTGGGKTLSSMAFALKHARLHGQRGIIYVAPFTSIIEQNAEVIREIVEQLATETYAPVIEHHSALSPEKENSVSRLAAENWDAPIVITTAVHFYESLFAAKTSRCRKLHRIANSVVIFDEAQTLPVSYLSACLRVIQELTGHYNTTAVLCTATQPAVHYHPEHFDIGFKDAREIVRDTPGLFSALKRVQITDLGPVGDAELADRIRAARQSLCIVNRRKHARELFERLGESDAHFHLSALMCPEHRSQTLAAIRQRLTEGWPVRVVSTQLVEAGVDVDFPVVFRALAGLDSIAQAAGRCNRHGKLDALGETYVFRPEDQQAEAYFRETAQVASQIIDQHDDLLGEPAIRRYFDLYYYEQSHRWDEKHILARQHMRLDRGNRQFPFHFDFRTIAQNFRLIDDWQEPVIVRFDQHAENLVDQLRAESIPLHRNLLRGLQRYTVQIRPNDLQANWNAFEHPRDGQFHVLISPELNYSTSFGLVLDEEHASSSFLNVE